jgi:hypothetical protein
MRTRTIILIGIGAFIAYSALVVYLAISDPTRRRLLRVTFIGQYAPWLLLSKGLIGWVFAYG